MSMSLREILEVNRFFRLLFIPLILVLSVMLLRPLTFSRLSSPFSLPISLSHSQSIYLSLPLSLSLSLSSLFFHFPFIIIFTHSFLLLQYCTNFSFVTGALQRFKSQIAEARYITSISKKFILILSFNTYVLHKRFSFFLLYTIQKNKFKSSTIIFLLERFFCEYLLSSSIL